MCSYLLQHLRERDTLAHTNPLPFQGPPSLRHNSYSRVKHNQTSVSVFHVLHSLLLQETLCRLMFSPNPLRYITVSKVGECTTLSCTHLQCLT